MKNFAKYMQLSKYQTEADSEIFMGHERKEYRFYLTIIFNCYIQISHLTAFSIQQLRILSFCTLDIGMCSLLA